MERESLQIGCIANIHRFFPDGKWSMQQWQNAKNQIAVDMQPFVRNYRNQGWKEAYGASGTIKALSDIAKNRAISDGTLTLKTLQLLREELIEFGTMQNIRWPQISVSRRHSIAGGLLTLETAFEELDIECMQTSDYALREGALFDILGRNKDHDPRLDSVKALQKRYSIDTEQAERVEGYALALFDQARKFWDLDAVDRETLSWACKLHEIGLTVAHSHHHHHGSYLIEHSDISGFSKTEQQRIAILIRNQRRSIHFKSLLTLNESRAIQGLRCILLLRISILLYRSHSAEKIPKFILSVSRSKLQLEIPHKWLAKHPLTRSDLDNEIAYLKAADITLAVIEK
jgi:exopolyphosphatase/guanosine-5'-triphosphate,3'-diphosphate pyrophosphatase